jgi:hypothetical protein
VLPLAIETQITLIGFGAFLSGLGAVFAGTAAWRRHKNEACDDVKAQAEHECNQRIVDLTERLLAERR